MAKSQPATRIRTCRCCGKRYEYPLKGIGATRYHCEECVNIPSEMIRTLERLSARITELESRLKAIEPKDSMDSF